MRARSTTSRLLVKPCRCIAAHRLAHPPDRGDLGLERLPVVALGDRRPDRLDLLDMHRAGRRVGPIGMGRRALAPFERRGERSERLATDRARRRDRGRRASRRRSGRSPTARDCERLRSAREPASRSSLAARGATPSRASSASTSAASNRAGPVGEQRRTAAAPRRSAPGSRRAAPGPSGSPRAGGRRRRARSGRNRRR